MQLKALKSKSKYKNTSAYLDAVYRKNKAQIDNNISPEWVAVYKTPKAAFKNLIKEQMKHFNYKTGKNYTVNQALKQKANSKDLNKTWGNKDIMYNNFQGLIKKDKELQKEFRKRIRDERGRFRKYDPKELSFRGYYASAEGNAAVYQFGDLVILEKKSPDKATGASISYMTQAQFDAAEGKTMFFKSWTAKGAR